MLPWFQAFPFMDSSDDAGAVASLGDGCFLFISMASRTYIEGVRASLNG